MISYLETAGGLTPDRLQGFFEGWAAPPTPDTHLKILEGSDAVVLAVDREGRVVGFVTAVSDGVLAAYIPLLEVLPEHRGRGIGTELMRRLLARLEGLYMVDLMCDPPLQAFYARFGMVPGTGMMIRRLRGGAGG